VNGVRAPNDTRKANRRGAARLAAVQALYQMDLAGSGLNEILAEFESHWLGREVEGEQYLPAEAAFFRELVGGVVAEQRRLDPMIDQALASGWPLKRVETILRAVLRAGAYELDRKPDIPARVIVSEYVDIANAFVDSDETGMINAVLDQIARQLRATEFDRTAGCHGEAAGRVGRGRADCALLSAAGDRGGRVRVGR
jgi:N utilization substance protein B